MDENNKSKNQVNNENNAKAVQAASKVMAKSGNPYAAAIGKGIQVADKISRGKASQKLGKATTFANKTSGMAGRIAQRATNKAAESGAVDRISKAKDKGKKTPASNIVSDSKNSVDEKTDNNNGDNFRENNIVDENNTPESGTINFKKDFKILVIGLKIFAAIFPIIMIIGLFIASSQIVVKAVGLGNADSLSDSEVEKKIDKKKDEELDEEATESEVGYNYYIDDSTFMTSKLSDLNLVKIANTEYLSRKYQAADLNELDDFYPDIVNPENHNQNLGYDFFWKMYTLYKNYRDNYETSDGSSLILDLPLLMATLYIQSDDIEVVFKSNLSDLDTKSWKRTKRMDEFNYDFDWSTQNYVSTKSISTHDMEILAQNMVSVDENGKYSLDLEKYKKFLKEFLYFKYISDSGYKPYTTGAAAHQQISEMIQDIYDMKEQYEFLAGSYDKKKGVNIINASSTNNSFWWPIGSSETTTGENGKLYATGDPVSTSITSYFGSTEAGIHDNGHGAIDISGPYQIGEVNIIAAKSGVVVIAVDEFNSIGRLGSTDGEGYGNHVKIQHSDGTATLYAHMAKNSIIVREGEAVEQGQVIGKMGSSGSSTGLHLHFEVRTAPGSYYDRVDPLNYVDINNPRPTVRGSGNSFDIYSTTLSKEEFISKMKDYCDRSNNEAFCSNFAKDAGRVYDVSIANNINPELVVVTAGTESGWRGCGYTNNYWGLNIPNGYSCDAGPSYKDVYEGIAGYAVALQDYGIAGKHTNWINERNQQRIDAGCDAAGHGAAGTLEGMQSIYSWVGSYRYNPGSSGLGGCYVLNYVYDVDNYCDLHPSCYGSSDANCPAESATTVCEQNDYTAWQLKGKRQLRFDIFGL